MTINTSDSFAYQNMDPQKWLNIIAPNEKKISLKNCLKNSLNNTYNTYGNLSPETIKKMDIQKIYDISQLIIAALPKNEIKSGKTATKINNALSRILEEKSDKLKETISLTNSTWVNALKWVALATILFIPAAAVIQVAQMIVTNIAKDELKTIQKLQEPLWVEETTNSVTKSFISLESFQKVEKEKSSPSKDAEIESSSSTEEEEWDDISLGENQEELKFKDDNRVIKDSETEIPTEAETTFRELLAGEKVNLQSKPLRPQNNNGILQIYVPEIVATDLPRFDLLRFNGKTIYSNFQQGINNDPVEAYHNLLKAFGEEPDFQPLPQDGKKNPLPSTNAPVTNTVLTALSQANLADLTNGTTFVEQNILDNEMIIHNQSLAEVSREIYLENGVLTIVAKALMYEVVPTIDSDETHAAAAHVISRKLVINLDQMKESIKNNAPEILIDFKGEDKISENLLIRKEGETIRDTPQIINSHDKSFRIKKELAYELLKKIS